MNQDGSNRVPFDLRAEIGLAHDVGRQTVPVLVNECIVRAFYSIRRFAKEITSLGIHTISDLQKVDPKAFLPIKSRELHSFLKTMGRSILSFLFVLSMKQRCSPNVKLPYQRKKLIP